MSAGFRTWSPDGKLKMDWTSRVTQIMGSFDTGFSAGSLAVQWPEGRIPFWVQIPKLSTHPKGTRLAAIDLTPTGITWEFGAFIPEGGTGDSTVWYGYF